MRLNPHLLRAAVFLGVISFSSLALGEEEPEAEERQLCPSDTALVGETCVDKYEASLVEILDDGTEVPFSPYEIPKKHRVRAVSRAGVVPQAYTSMYEARRACVASGKRLCRGPEWKAACRGPNKTIYPYGPSRIPGACVDTRRVSPVMKLFGGGFHDEHMNDPRLNQLDRTLEPTGTAAACTNAYGVHDMVGNLHEWTDDGIFRGGYYLDTEINGEGCTYVTAAHAPFYHDYSTGFRCCADAGTLPIDDEEADLTEPSFEMRKKEEKPVLDDEVEGDSGPLEWELGKSVPRALAPRPRHNRRRR